MNDPQAPAPSRKLSPGADDLVVRMRRHNQNAAATEWFLNSHNGESCGRRTLRIARDAEAGWYDAGERRSVRG